MIELIVIQGQSEVHCEMESDGTRFFTGGPLKSVSVTPGKETFTVKMVSGRTDTATVDRVAHQIPGQDRKGVYVAKTFMPLAGGTPRYRNGVVDWVESLAPGTRFSASDCPLTGKEGGPQTRTVSHHILNAAADGLCKATGDRVRKTGAFIYERLRIR